MIFLDENIGIYTHAPRRLSLRSDSRLLQFLRAIREKSPLNPVRIVTIMWMPLADNNNRGGKTLDPVSVKTPAARARAKNAKERMRREKVGET